MGNWQRKNPVHRKLGWKKLSELPTGYRNMKDRAEEAWKACKGQLPEQPDPRPSRVAAAREKVEPGGPRSSADTDQDYEEGFAYPDAEGTAYKRAVRKAMEGLKEKRYSHLPHAWWVLLLALTVLRIEPGLCIQWAIEAAIPRAAFGCIAV